MAVSAPLWMRHFETERNLLITELDRIIRDSAPSAGSAPLSCSPRLVQLYRGPIIYASTVTRRNSRRMSNSPRRSFQNQTSEIAKSCCFIWISHHDSKHLHGQACSAYCWLFLSGRIGKRIMSCQLFWLAQASIQLGATPGIDREPGRAGARRHPPKRGTPRGFHHGELPVMAALALPATECHRHARPLPEIASKYSRAQRSGPLLRT